MAEIKIAYDEEDIKNRSDSEKLNLLIKIAFVNHRTLAEHGKILFGNGKSGICDQVRQNYKGIRVVYGLLVIVLAAIAGMVFR